MTRTIKILLILVILTLTGELHSQGIRGKVIDATTSEALIGATIKVVNTNSGANAEMDGTYIIEGLKPGTYDITFSYIGYTACTVKDVIVKSSEFTKLDATLSVDGLTTEEIVVQSSMLTSNENTLLVEQKNSENIQNGISEQQIKRAPDASASDVMKRIIGITVVNDKYIFVRGISERYNNTTLNGVLLPSTDPDKKAFSFDLFPSNLLDNITVSKTFSADKPANYSGGLVQITTKEFPDAFTLNLSANSSFNDNTSTQTFFDYNASEKKFFGINLGLDNSRMLPANFPTGQLKNNYFTREQITEISRSLPNNWEQKGIKAPLNSGFSMSIGNEYKLGNIPVGVLASFSNKTSFTNKKVERNDFNTDNSKISHYNGMNSEFSVLWGGLLNLNFKLNEFNRISFKSVFTVSSDDETQYYEGFVNGSQGSDAFDRKLYVTQFTQRTLSSLQFFGDHLLKSLNNIHIDWKYSYSESIRKEPDLKTMTYQREFNSQNEYYAAINPNFGNTYAGGRFFSDLNDINRSMAFNAEIPFKLKIPFSDLKATNSKLKIGVFANGTTRYFSARNFGVGYYIGMPFDVLYRPIGEIFDPQNFDVNKLFYDELTSESDKYNAAENNYAGYMMVDIPLERFRFIIGTRYEYDDQRVNTLGVIKNPVSRYLKNIDILPSLNFVYKLNDNTNIRASYSQTICRPELREIAPFSYVDFVSGILVVGNSTDLHRTIVRNYDLRYELYPAPGEIISASLFYKKIDSPIEEVFIPTTSNRLKTFKNAEAGAFNYGIELEFRKNLGFISKILNDFSLNSNLAFINSKVSFEGVTTTATTKERRLQGQSPYMVNLGLYYDNYNIGTSINITYNRFGERIMEVGTNGYNDIRELPRDFLDLTFVKKLLGKFELKFSVKDILNQQQKFVQLVSGKDEPVKIFTTGTSYSLTLSYKY